MEKYAPKFSTLAKPIQPKSCGRLVSTIILADGKQMKRWESLMGDEQARVAKRRKTKYIKLVLY